MQQMVLQLLFVIIFKEMELKQAQVTQAGKVFCRTTHTDLKNR